MKYRKFGPLDWKSSVLGFGAMRLPIIDGDSGQIDEPEATRMIRYAIDQGVNYVDTAYPYHKGNSEHFVGRALKDGYRERVKLATKLPCWEVKEESDFDRLLDLQREKLQVEKIDLYLLHALNAKYWSNMRELKVLDSAERAMADGRIGCLGFSFHDEYKVFPEIIDGYDNWTFCQIQYNFMDTEYQAGRKGLQYAADKGLAVVVMEPLRGGSLVKKVPPSIQEIWDDAPRRRSPADAALQWVWNHPQVSVVLSGMSTMEHVQQNVTSAEQSGANTLTTEELGVYERVREKYESICPIPCTDCKYCLPCPSGVNIPHVFDIYNELMMYGNDSTANWLYNVQLGEDQRANLCTVCGECLEKCPQQIEIPEWLEKAHELLCGELSPSWPAS